MWLTVHDHSWDKSARLSEPVIFVREKKTSINDLVCVVERCMNIVCGLQFMITPGTRVRICPNWLPLYEKKNINQ